MNIVSVFWVLKEIHVFPQELVIRLCTAQPPLCDSHTPDTFPLSNSKTCVEVGAILEKSSFFWSLEMNMRIILLLYSAEVWLKHFFNVWLFRMVQFRGSNVRPWFLYWRRKKGHLASLWNGSILPGVNSFRGEYRFEDKSESFSLFQGSVSWIHNVFRAWN